MTAEEKAKVREAAESWCEEYGYGTLEGHVGAFIVGAAMGYALALDAVLASIEDEHPILACRAIAGYVLALRGRAG